MLISFLKPSIFYLSRVHQYRASCPEWWPILGFDSSAFPWSSNGALFGSFPLYILWLFAKKYSLSHAVSDALSGCNIFFSEKIKEGRENKEIKKGEKIKNQIASRKCIQFARNFICVIRCIVGRPVQSFGMIRQIKLIKIW